MNIIRQEKPSYTTLLFRKSSKVKLIETGAFLLLVTVLAYALTFSHPYIEAAVIAVAVLTLGLSPLIYKVIVQPEYILTNTELVIKKMGKETRYPLTKVKDAHDLRFFFLLDGQKTNLTVSDDFLAKLNHQLEIVNKKLK